MVYTEELIRLFRENFPHVIRGDETVKEILSGPDNHVLYRRNDMGKLIAASVIHKSNVLLFCVDEAHRRKGIGSALLQETEQLISQAGYREMSVGAGEAYLAPGIPTGIMPAEEALGPERLYEGLNDDAAAFFRRRGYFHSWGDCNCFDMRVPLDALPPVESSIGDEIEGATYRWAEETDRQAVCACTDDAYDKFTKYYADSALYEPDSGKRVLIAEKDGCICGTLIVSMRGEAEGMGSVGCTAVRHAYRGRHIAANLVRLGTQSLKEAGLSEAFLGYTYSGLDKLYGFAGYRICVYYMMAKKQLERG